MCEYVTIFTKKRKIYAKINKNHQQCLRKILVSEDLGKIQKVMVSSFNYLFEFYYHIIQHIILYDELIPDIQSDLFKSSFVDLTEGLNIFGHFLSFFLPRCSQKSDWIFFGTQSGENTVYLPHPCVKTSSQLIWMAQKLIF